MSSIFGSAKASQEADNVLILQVIKGRGVSKRIQVQIDQNTYTLCGYTHIAVIVSSLG